MKTYQVEISNSAERDLKEIVRYIYYDFRAPDTAIKQYQSIHAQIQTLEYMPERYPLWEDEPWYSAGIRKLLVNNYYILYSVDQERLVVRIARIVYAGRNISEQLQNTDWDNL